MHDRMVAYLFIAGLFFCQRACMDSILVGHVGRIQFLSNAVSPALIAIVLWVELYTVNLVLFKTWNGQALLNSGIAALAMMLLLLCPISDLLTDTLYLEALAVLVFAIANEITSRRRTS
jgi:hypothetical protein